MGKFFIFGVLFSLLMGCADDEKLKPVESSGQFPKLERSESLTGIDSNKNGIRDDIDQYIIKTYQNPKQRAAVVQLSQAIQKTLLADTTDLNEVKKINAEVSGAFECIYRQFEVSEKYIVTKEVEAMTTNTKPRLLAYLAFNKALDGTSWKTPEGDVCK